MRRKSKIRKVAKFIGLLIALGAVISPFWLSSETDSSKPAQVTPAIPASQGRTGQLSLDELQLYDGGLTAPLAPQSDADPKPNQNSADSASTEPAAPALVPNDHSKATTGTIPTPENVSPTPAPAPQEQPAPPVAQKTSPVPTPDGNDRTGEINPNDTTSGIEEEVLPLPADQQKPAPNQLQKELDRILENQSAQEKADYEEDLAIRRTINDNAIASITQGSALYLPPVLGERALVVRYYIESSLPEQADHIDPALHKSASGIKFVSELLSEVSRTPVYTISTAAVYPQDFTQFFEQTAKELAEHSRPELIDDVPLDLSQYDTIYFCFPVWHQDMPCACYSFFAKYDLSGKNIIPVYMYNEPPQKQLSAQINALEPNALVSSRALSFQRKEVTSKEQTRQTIVNWLEKLSTDFN